LSSFVGGNTTTPSGPFVPLCVLDRKRKAKEQPHPPTNTRNRQNRPRKLDMSTTTTTYETRTYSSDGNAASAAYKADDWLARKRWMGLSSCTWILIAAVALILILVIIGIVGALNNRRY
jgi:hypothetical protein